MQFLLCELAVLNKSVEFVADGFVQSFLPLMIVEGSLSLSFQIVTPLNQLILHHELFHEHVLQVAGVSLSVEATNTIRPLCSLTIIAAEKGLRAAGLLKSNVISFADRYTPLMFILHFISNITKLKFQI